MKKIILHAGQHKTGTTSIQRYMAQNIDFFSANGISIIQNSGKHLGEVQSTNCFDLAHVVLRPELKTPMRITGRVTARIKHGEQEAEARCVNERLHKLSGRNFLLSAEAFSFLRTHQERAIFNVMFSGFDVHALMFLREAQSWMKSWIKQTAKLFSAVSEEDRHRNSIFNYDDDSWLLDHEKIKTFFQCNGIFLSYEAEMQNHGNIIPALLREIGISTSICPDWGNTWENRT